MRIVLTLFLFCVCMSIKAQQQDMTEMKKAIDLMQGMYDITFVYDSSLVTSLPLGRKFFEGKLGKDFWRHRHKMGNPRRIRPAVPSEQLYLFWICV